MVNDSLPNVAFGNVGLKAKSASRFLSSFRLNHYSSAHSFAAFARLRDIFRAPHFRFKER
jgi:hypothetical protein